MARRAQFTLPLEDGRTVGANFKGPTWLWQCTVAESKEHRPATRTHAQTDYQPGTWRWTVQNIFREFNAKREKKHKGRPHDLRARAITLVAAATQSVDANAEALGLDSQTACTISTAPPRSRGPNSSRSWRASSCPRSRRKRQPADGTGGSSERTEPPQNP